LDSRQEKKLYEFPFARKPMTGLGYLLVPSRRNRRLQVRSGPGTGLVFTHFELAPQERGMAMDKFLKVASEPLPSIVQV